MSDRHRLNWMEEVQMEDQDSDVFAWGDGGAQPGIGRPLQPFYCSEECAKAQRAGPVVPITRRMVKEMKENDEDPPTMCATCQTPLR